MPPCSNTHAVSSRTRYNVQPEPLVTRYPTCMLKSYTMRLAVWPATRSTATPYTVHWSATRPTPRRHGRICARRKLRKHISARELQPVRPTAPPLDGPHGMPLPRRSRQSYGGERKSIHAGGCARLRTQWPERGPHAKKVSSGPHAGEGFVRTPCMIPSVAP